MQTILLERIKGEAFLTSSKLGKLRLQSKAVLGHGMSSLAGGGLGESLWTARGRVAWPWKIRLVVRGIEK